MVLCHHMSALAFSDDHLEEMGIVRWRRRATSVDSIDEAESFAASISLLDSPQTTPSQTVNINFCFEHQPTLRPKLLVIAAELNDNTHRLLLRILKAIKIAPEEYICLSAVQTASRGFPLKQMPFVLEAFENPTVLVFGAELAARLPTFEDACVVDGLQKMLDQPQCKAKAWEGLQGLMERIHL
jgi:DNA polymerase III psi subunit